MSTDLALDLLHVSHASQLLVASDYDGTLADFVDDPAKAEPQPGVMQALLQLAACDNTTCAIVSSRTTDDLAARLAHPTGLILAGSFGSEIVSETPRSARAMMQLANAWTLLQEVAARYPGTWIERKPAALVFHTRKLREPLASIAQSVARATLAPLDGLHVMAGHSVVEWCAFVPDKLAAVEALRVRLNASAVVYLGDTDADERVFAALRPGDVSVRVGEGVTRAKHRVASPAIATWVLQTLAESREDFTRSASHTRDTARITSTDQARA